MSSDFNKVLLDESSKNGVKLEMNKKSRTPKKVKKTAVAKSKTNVGGGKIKKTEKSYVSKIPPGNSKGEKIKNFLNKSYLSKIIGFLKEA